MTEFGNIDLVEERETREGGNVKLKLPGVHKGDLAARSFKPEINVFDVKFSPTGKIIFFPLLILFKKQVTFEKNRFIMGSCNNRRCVNIFN